MTASALQTLGVIADTHVPDRTRRLHPKALAIFKQAKVQSILHAGDISTPYVIAELEQVAPVYAVRGNRDWIWLRHLPVSLHLTFAGAPLVLTHGHGSLPAYLCNHLAILLRGYRSGPFVKPLLKRFPQAKVIVFGHTHIPYNQWVDGQLIFNPGSSYVTHRRKQAPSVGLLHISAEGRIRAEIIKLT